MPASDWWFNIGIVVAVVLTIIAGVNWGVWAFANSAAIAAMYIWNGARPIKRAYPHTNVEAD